jgi:hypothetical protein
MPPKKGKSSRPDPFSKWQNEVTEGMTLSFIDNSQGHLFVFSTVAATPQQIEVYVKAKVSAIDPLSMYIETNDGSFLLPNNRHFTLEVHTNQNIINCVKRFMRHKFVYEKTLTALYIYSDPTVHFIMYMEGVSNKIFPNHLMTSPYSDWNSIQITRKNGLYIEPPVVLEISHWSFFTSGLRLAGLTCAPWFASALPALFILSDVQRFLGYLHRNSITVYTFMSSLGRGREGRDIQNNFVLIRQLVGLFSILCKTRHTVDLANFLDTFFRLGAWEETAFKRRGTLSANMPVQCPVELLKTIMDKSNMATIAFNTLVPLDSTEMPDLFGQAKVVIFREVACPHCKTPVEQTTTNQCCIEVCLQSPFPDNFLGDQFGKINANEALKCKTCAGEMTVNSHHFHVGNRLLVHFKRGSSAAPVSIAPLLVPSKVNDRLNIQVMLPQHLILHSSERHDYLVLVYDEETFSYGDPHQKTPVVYRGVTATDHDTLHGVILERPWLMGQLTYDQLTERFGEFVISIVYKYAYMFDL